MNRIIFDFHYSAAKLPQFSSDDEANRYFAALGRAIYYAANDRDSEVQYIAAGQHDKDEFVCVYHTPVPEYTVTSEGKRVWTDNTPAKVCQALRDLAVDARERGRPFVVGSVQDREGNWGRHS